MKKILLTLTVVLFCVYFAKAQVITDDEDFQSWNDVQITARMTEHFDYFFQLTGRFGDTVRQLSDRRVAVGFVWKPYKDFAVTPFYWNIEARNSAGSFRTENELNLRTNYRFPFKKFGLANRSQYEYRMRSPRNSWRFRTMMTVDKDLLKSFLPHSKVYVSDEIFYDSLITKFNRNRFTVGVTKTLNKHLNLDVYFMRQNDGYAHPGDLSVIGTNWKIHY